MTRFESEVSEAEFAYGQTTTVTAPTQVQAQTRKSAVSHDLSEAEYAYLQKLVERNLAQMADYPDMFKAERRTVTTVQSKLHGLRRNAQLDLIQQ